MHSGFEENIKQHQFPKDIIQKVNKFPEDMMALQIEEEGGREIGWGAWGVCITDCGNIS